MAVTKASPEDSQFPLIDVYFGYAMETGTPYPHHQERRLWIVGSLIAITLFAAILIYLRLQQPDDSVTVNQGIPALATPDSYTDFYGMVTDVTEASLTVESLIQLPDGTQRIKTSQVMTSDQTVVQRVVAETDPIEAAFTDIPVGAMVQVFSDQDLANLTEFTATRIHFETTS